MYCRAKYVYTSVWLGQYIRNTVSMQLLIRYALLLCFRFLNFCSDCPVVTVRPCKVRNVYCSFSLAMHVQFTSSKGSFATRKLNVVSQH